jgi:hypothetical protein
MCVVGSYCFVALFLCAGVRGFYFLLKWGYLFMRLIKYLLAEFLCSGGWYESLCMIRSLVVGFLYILKASLLCVLSVVTTR